MKIYVVDNGGQWTHREWRVLKYLKVETKIIPNTTSFDEIGEVDALVLSGGSPRVAEESGRMGNNGEYLDRADFPILGICAGMHFMSGYFGGATAPAKISEFGKTTLYIDDVDDLFIGLPKTFTVWESHNDEVSILPRVSKCWRDPTTAKSRQSEWSAARYTGSNSIQKLRIPSMAMRSSRIF